MPNHINEKIKQAILECKPEIFGKIGGIEASHLYQFLMTGLPKLVRDNTLYVNAGIFCEDDFDLREWCIEYIKAIKNVDYMLQWCPEQGDQTVIQSIWQGKELFFDFAGLEPFTLGQDGWHNYLSDKTLLVIAPFKDTILKQVEKYPLLWNGSMVKEVKIVKSPYSEALTGKKPIKWQNKLDKMLDDINDIGEFDVATVGCGGFSLLVCDYIKSLGKPSIHLGGGNQLLFGIRGKRWDASFAKYDWYGTKDWIRPITEEIPQYNNLVEGGCYW